MQLEEQHQRIIVNHCVCITARNSLDNRIFKTGSKFHKNSNETQVRRRLGLLPVQIGLSNNFYTYKLSLNSRGSFNAEGFATLDINTRDHNSRKFFELLKQIQQQAGGFDERRKNQLMEQSMQTIGTECINNWETFIEHANMYYRNGLYKEALSVYNESIELFTKVPFATRTSDSNLLYSILESLAIS